MKNRITAFVSGILVTIMLMGVSVTALAWDGTLRLEGHPIQVLVNGEIFHPKDANGSDVLVFAVNGTTYAPLRALAEAYGLEVGYDAERNIATVSGQSTGTHAPAPSPVPDKTPDFKSQWEIAENHVTHNGTEKVFTASYSGSLSQSDFCRWWASMNQHDIETWSEELAAEVQAMYPDYTVELYFTFHDRSLGTAYAFGSYEGSNFLEASLWIK